MLSEAEAKSCISLTKCKHMKDLKYDSWDKSGCNYIYLYEISPASSFHSSILPPPQVNGGDRDTPAVPPRRWHGSDQNRKAVQVWLSV